LFIVFFAIDIVFVVVIVVVAALVFFATLTA
jgi:hypothetical protein